MTRHVVAHSKCNLGCTYCYEETGREYSQPEIDSSYDFDAVMEKVKKWVKEDPETPIGAHGGEPLLMRDEHLEELFEYMHSEVGRSHIQTNGTLLTDEHIRMFEEYDVSVGISCDGPAELNSERKARSGVEDITQNMTKATHDAIDRIMESDVNLGIIVVLHRVNAGTNERFERLLDWMDTLNENDVSGHYNPAIPYEDIQDGLSLSPTRLKEVYLRTWEWMLQEDYRKWDPLRRMQDNLLGLGLGSCSNGKCDVFNTQAAQTVTGQGNTSGCGKTWEAVGDGVTFLQGESTGNEYGETKERYEMLKQLPGPHTKSVKEGKMEDQGGCKGCKYWNVCYGGCPAAGIDDDYRNRTQFCEAQYATYERIESDMRRLFPGLTMITDLPWDAEIQDREKLGPFIELSSESTANPSVTGDPNHDKSVNERLEHLTESFEETIEQYKEKYPAEILTIKPEDESIHADGPTRN